MLITHKIKNSKFNYSLKINKEYLWNCGTFSKRAVDKPWFLLTMDVLFFYAACYNIIDFQKYRICKLHYIHSITDNKACAGLELGSGPIHCFPKYSNLLNSRSNNSEKTIPSGKISK